MRHDGVCTDSCMVADVEGAEDLGAGTNVDVTADAYGSGDGHLLEYEAVRAYDRVRVYDDAGGMRNQKSTLNSGIDWDVRCGHDTPESMTGDGKNFSDAENGITLVA